MRILFVINNVYTEGNGLSGSCRRTVKLLRDAGEDVRLLSATGYRPEVLQPVDMFPHTDHIETVLSLSRAHG